MSKKLIVPIIGLIICFLGLAIQLTNINNSDKLPEFIQGKGLLVVIFGMLLATVFPLFLRMKKK